MQPTPSAAKSGLEPAHGNQERQRERGDRPPQRHRRLPDAERKALRSLASNHPYHRTPAGCAHACPGHAGEGQQRRERAEGRQRRRQEEAGSRAAQSEGDDRPLTDAVGDETPRQQRQHHSPAGAGEQQADLAEREAGFVPEAPVRERQCRVPARSTRPGQRRPHRGRPSGSARVPLAGVAGAAQTPAQLGDEARAGRVAQCVALLASELAGTAGGLSAFAGPRLPCRARTCRRPRPPARRGPRPGSSGLRARAYALKSACASARTTLGNRRLDVGEASSLPVPDPDRPR